MKAVILAGGLGTRLAEETILRPKPMVEIGGKPILWHIMKIYSTFGVNEFIITLGYKGEMIKDYFLNFNAYNNDISIDFTKGQATLHEGNHPPWIVHLVDTGLYTQTGGRLRRLKDWLEGEETFIFAYGDGVVDIDILALERCHKSHGKIATVTTVRSPERFGRIVFEENRVVEFFLKNPSPGKDGSMENSSFSIMRPLTMWKEITRSGSGNVLKNWRMMGN